MIQNGCTLLSNKVCEMTHSLRTAGLIPFLSRAVGSSINRDICNEDYLCGSDFEVCLLAALTRQIVPVRQIRIEHAC